MAAAQSSPKAPSQETSPAVTADVRLEGVTKRFDDVVAVDDISLEVPRGQLLRAARPLGLRQDDDPADDRRLRGADRGRDLPRRPRRRRAAAVQARREHGLPELRALPAPLDLRERRVRDAPQGSAQGSDIAGRVREILRLVDLQGMEKRKPRQLSGGQQQRVALARALVNKPRVLLLDEPLGALDLKLRRQMQLELKAIQHDVGITFIHVTHDQEEAMTMADTIAVMNKGRVEQLGPPERALRAAADRVRRRLPRSVEPPAGHRDRPDDDRRRRRPRGRGLARSARRPHRPASRSASGRRRSASARTRRTPCPGRSSSPRTSASRPSTSSTRPPGA